MTPAARHYAEYLRVNAGGSPILALLLLWLRPR